MSNFVIAKCVDVISPEINVVELTFDREVDLKCHVVRVSNSKTLSFEFVNKHGIWKQTLTNISLYKDYLLNKYVVIYSTINNMNHTVILPSKEEIWKQLGSLENPELEEINCYIRLLNE